MVDETAPAPAANEPATPPPAAATDPAALSIATAADPPPVPPLTAGDPPRTSERENWLRERFEREHEYTLSLMRLLLEGLSHEGRGLRLWRWLIDDYRSERRLAADFTEPQTHERQLLRRILGWARSQRLLTRNQ